MGGVVALALIGAVLWFFKRRGRKGPEEQQQQPHAQDPYFPPPKPPAPQYFVRPGLHEAEGIVDDRDTSQLDSSEKYEIADQKKDSMARQEME